MTDRSATTLERAIARARTGDLSPDVVMWTFAASEVLFLNNTPVSGDQPPEDPMLLTRDDGRFLATFPYRDLIPGDFLEGRDVVAIPALELLRRLPAGVGLMVNPGTRLGFEVPAEGAHVLAADLFGTVVSP